MAAFNTIAEKNGYKLIYTAGVIKISYPQDSIRDCLEISQKKEGNKITVAVKVKDDVFSSSLPIVQKKVKDNLAQAEEAAQYFTGITAEEIK